jgi:hypothetical protein
MRSNRHARTAWRTALAAVVWAQCAGCHRAVTLVTTERASWSYVEEAWGGLQVSDSAVEDGRLRLRLRSHVHAVTRVDSGICVRAVSARVDETRVLVRLDKAVCDPKGPPPPSNEVSIASPPAGTYAVLYDDAAAGFPRLGQARVPNAVSR